MIDHGGEVDVEVGACAAAQVKDFKAGPVGGAQAGHVDHIVAHEQGVNAGTTVHAAVGAVKHHHVVAQTRKDGVVARTAVEPVGVGVSGDAVVKTAAQHAFDAVERVGAGGACGGGNG